MFDISERKETEQELERLRKELEVLSFQDGLTGLGNRRLFDQVLSSYEKADKEQKTLIGVLCLGAFAFALGGDRRQEKALDKVVLYFRNRKLAERILADDSDKIYMT